MNKTISECTSAWLFGDEGLMDLPNRHGLATEPAGPSYWNDPGYEFGPTGLQMLSGLPNPTEPLGFVPGTNNGWRSEQWNDLLIDSSKDSVKLHDSNADIHRDFKEFSASDDQVSHLPFARVSQRKRTLTEKGLYYQVDLQVKVLKSSIRSHKNLMQQCRLLLSQDRPTLESLYDARKRAEVCLTKVSDCFNNLGSYCLESCQQFQDSFDECKIESRVLLQNITEVIRSLTISEKTSQSCAKSQTSGQSAPTHCTSSKTGSSKSGRSQRSAKLLKLQHERLSLKQI